LVQFGRRTYIYLQLIHLIKVKIKLDLYSSQNITRQIKSRRTRWAGHVARMRLERNLYKVLVGKPEGKRPLGRSRLRWEDCLGVWSGFGWLRIGTGSGFWRREFGEGKAVFAL
jgi:hypothetical protein